MNRARDYINFAVKFVGLGYVALWPLSVTTTTGDVFGAGLLCTGRFGAAVEQLCRLPHPLRLNLGLHVVGAVFAGAALVHLAALAVRAHRAPGPGAAAPGAAPPSTVARRMRRFRLSPLPKPRKPGKPRKEFGLRGVPR